MDKEQLRCAHCGEPIAKKNWKPWMTIRLRDGHAYHFCEKEACEDAGFALMNSDGDRKR